MLQRLFVLAVIFVCASLARAADIYDCYNGSSEQGGHKITVNGIESRQFVQQSYPGATVTVYDHSTTTLSTVFQDAGGLQPLANPFTASSTGVSFWCAADGHYDVKYSGTGITAPFTVSDIHLAFTTGGGGGGGGNLSGTLTAGLIPVASAPHTLVDSSIADDFNTVTSTDTGGFSGTQYTATGTCPGSTGGTGCMDIGTGTQPSNPVTNFLRLWGDATSGHVKCLNSTGGDCSLGTVTNITATTPIVVTPSPLTGVGVISCPTCGTGSGTVSGSGTTGKLPKWTSATVLGDSAVQQSVRTAQAEIDINGPYLNIDQGAANVSYLSCGLVTAAACSSGMIIGPQLQNVGGSQIRMNPVGGGGGIQFNANNTLGSMGIIDGGATFQAPIVQFSNQSSATFANLPSPVAGYQVFCFDCKEGTDPCTAGGSGTFAFGVNVGSPKWSCINGSPLAQYKRLRCSTGLGDGVNAMAAATYVMLSCVNDSGVTWTVTAVHCFTDNAGTSTLDVKNNAGTSFLTGAVTCNSTKTSGGAAGTQSATTTLANTDAFNFTFVADGTSKTTTWTISLTQ